MVINKITDWISTGPQGSNWKFINQIFHLVFRQMRLFSNSNYININKLNADITTVMLKFCIFYIKHVWRVHVYTCTAINYRKIIKSYWTRSDYKLTKTMILQHVTSFSRICDYIYYTYISWFSLCKSKLELVFLFCVVGCRDLCYLRVKYVLQSDVELEVEGSTVSRTRMDDLNNKVYNCIKYNSHMVISVQKDKIISALIICIWFLIQFTVPT